MADTAAGPFPSDADSYEMLHILGKLPACFLFFSPHLEFLGEGSTAAVYTMSCKSNGVPVAVKVSTFYFFKHCTASDAMQQIDLEENSVDLDEIRVSLAFSHLSTIASS